MLSDDLLFYHLDDVDCTGNENMLSDCNHGGIGIHNCFEGEEAGVICSCKFQLFSVSIIAALHAIMYIP